MTTHRRCTSTVTPTARSARAAIAIVAALLVLVGQLALAQLPDPDIDLTWPDDAPIPPEAFFDEALPEAARDLAPGTGVFTLDGHEIEVVPVVCRVQRRDSRTDLMILTVHASNPSGARYPVVELERDGTGFQAATFGMRQNPEHPAFWRATHRGSPGGPDTGAPRHGEIGFDDVFVTADGRVWAQAIAERYDGDGTATLALEVRCL
jgi:hypothetical protein